MINMGLQSFEFASVVTRPESEGRNGENGSLYLLGLSELHDHSIIVPIQPEISREFVHVNNVF